MLGLSDWVLFFIWGSYLLLVGLFIYRTTTKNRYATILSIGLIFGLIGLSFAAFRPFFSHDSVFYNSYWLFSNGIFYLLLYFFVYIHFSLADKTNPNIVFTIVLASLLGLGVGTSVALISMSDMPSVFIMLNDFAHDSLRLLAFLYATVIVWKTWRSTEEINGLLELIAMLFFVFSVIPAVFANYIRIFEDIDLLYLIGDLFSLIGLVLLTSNYITNPDYLYRIPKPLYLIALFNSTGITLYSRTVKTKSIDVDKIPTQVISGIITATSLVMKEGFGEGAYLKVVESTRHTLLFSVRGELTAMILAEQPSYFVKKSLDNFLKFIPDDLVKKLEESTTNVDKETSDVLDRYLVNAYPYIVFS
ncbi:MAG: hypothetical protein ACP6IU_13825 [Candidatus Asgardarchaeia archaeon]